MAQLVLDYTITSQVLTIILTNLRVKLKKYKVLAGELNL